MEVERADDGWAIKWCTVIWLPLHFNQVKQRWTHHIQHTTTNENGVLYFSYVGIQK